MGARKRSRAGSQPLRAEDVKHRLANVVTAPASDPSPTEAVHLVQKHRSGKPDGEGPRRPERAT